MKSRHPNEATKASPSFKPTVAAAAVNKTAPAAVVEGAACALKDALAARKDWGELEGMGLKTAARAQGWNKSNWKSALASAPVVAECIAEAKTDIVVAAPHPVAEVVAPSAAAEAADEAVQIKATDDALQMMKNERTVKLKEVFAVFDLNNSGAIESAELLQLGQARGNDGEKVLCSHFSTLSSVSRYLLLR